MKQHFSRIIALALVLVMALGLVACGGETPASSAPADEADAASFDYSSALEENGHWKDIDAKKIVTLPEDYMSIKLSAEAANVTDEQLQSMLDDILNSMSTEYVHITDRAVAKDDVVSIDYVGSVDGVEFTGGNTNNAGAIVTAGSNQYVDDFLTQIIDHKPGETIDVVVTFPEDYKDSTDADGNPVVLAGKEGLFKTTINYIQGEKILPELTDEFVKENYGPDAGLGFSYTTVDELKAGLKADMLDAQKHEFVNQYLMDSSKIDEIPASVVDHLKQTALADIAMQAASYGMSTADLLGMQGMTEESFLQAIDEDAKNTAKLYLILQAIAETEGIEVTEEAARAELGENYDEIVKAYGLGYTNLVMLNKTAMDAVVAAAK